MEKMLEMNIEDTTNKSSDDEIKVPVSNGWNIQAPPF